MRFIFSCQRGINLVTFDLVIEIYQVVGMVDVFMFEVVGMFEVLGMFVVGSCCM